MQPDVDIGERELVLFCLGRNYGSATGVSDYDQSAGSSIGFDEPEQNYNLSSDYGNSSYNGSDLTEENDLNLCSLYWNEGMYDNHQVPMALAYGLFAAVGMCSNFVIFYVLISEHRVSSRKTPSQSFVLSLCLADTFQLSSLPFKMDVRLWWGCWRYGKYACVFHNSVTNINLFVSVFFLVMLSIDRYVVIMPPDKLKSLKKARAHPHYVTVTTIMIWSCAILLAIPTLTHSTFDNNQCSVDWTSKNDPPLEEPHMCKVCSPKDENGQPDSRCTDAKLTDVEHQAVNQTISGLYKNVTANDYCTGESHIELIHSSCFCPAALRYRQYLSSIFILSYILPLSIIISCYSRIIIISINSAKVAKARENIGSKKPSSRSKGSRDQKVTRIILVLVVTFFCCWTPFHFRNLLRVLNVHLYHSTCSLIDDLANIGAAANSVVNPFIYSFLSTQFRQKLTSILERKIRKHNTSRSGSSRPQLRRLHMKTNEKKQLIQTNRQNEIGTDSPSGMSTTIVSSRCDL